MAVLPAPTRPASNGRVRRAVNVVLVLAVLVDFAAQALHVVRPGAAPLLILIAALALPAALWLWRGAR